MEHKKYIYKWTKISGGRWRADQSLDMAGTGRGGGDGGTVLASQYFLSSPLHSAEKRKIHVYRVNFNY